MFSVGLKHIRALWSYLVFVEFAQFSLCIVHLFTSHQDTSMTQDLPHAELTFLSQVNASLTQERVLVKML